MWWKGWGRGGPAPPDNYGLSWDVGYSLSPPSPGSRESSKRAPTFLPRSLLLDGWYQCLNVQFRQAFERQGDSKLNMGLS